MKKAISVVLSVLMLFSCFAVCAFAETPYSNVWTVTADSDSAKQIAVQLVKNVGTEDAPAFVICKDENGACLFNEDGSLKLEAAERDYIIDGETVYFTIVTLGSNRPDQTTVYRALPEGYKLEILTSEEIEVLGEVIKPIDAVYETVYEDGMPTTARERTSDKEEIYEVSANVYCLSDVRESKYIKAYNLQSESISGIKDFLLNFYRFFLQLLQWFFGLDVDIP